MATSDPWRCRFCKVMAKATANGCSRCLRHWEECQDWDFVPNQPKAKNKKSKQEHWGDGWTYSADYGDATPRTPRTPRGTKIEQSWRQQPQPPQPGKGKGKKKGVKGKGKGKEADQGVKAGATEIPPEPPWNPYVNSGQALSPLPPPTSPPPLSQEEQDLKELLAALSKSPQEMTPDVKALVQKHSLKQGQKATQGLYSAVDEIGTAREAFDNAVLARHELHIRWRNFLSEAVARWTGHAANFQKEEQELTAQIEVAKQALAEAAKKFENSKVEVGGVVEIEKANTSTTSTGADLEAQAHLGKTLQDSLQIMKSNLEQLSASAEAMVVEENVSNKRQRTAEPGEGDVPLGMPSPSAPALQPFPNRETSFPLPDKA
eukprot:s3397_g2.t1